jgi:hypothetical protein
MDGGTETIHPLAVGTGSKRGIGMPETYQSRHESPSQKIHQLSPDSKNLSNTQKNHRPTFF